MPRHCESHPVTRVRPTYSSITSILPTCLPHVTRDAEIRRFHLQGTRRRPLASEQSLLVHRVAPARVWRAATALNEPAIAATTISGPAVATQHKDRIERPSPIITVLETSDMCEDVQQSGVGVVHAPRHEEVGSSTKSTRKTVIAASERVRSIGEAATRADGAKDEPRDYECGDQCQYGVRLAQDRIITTWHLPTYYDDHACAIANVCPTSQSSVHHRPPPPKSYTLKVSPSIGTSACAAV